MTAQGKRGKRAQPWGKIPTRFPCADRKPTHRIAVMDNSRGFQPTEPYAPLNIPCRVATQERLLPPVIVPIPLDIPVSRRDTYAKTGTIPVG